MNSTRRCCARVPALLVVLAAAAWLWAHEGHQPLPARGVRVDAATGRLQLSAAVRAALDVQTEEVRVRSVAKRLTLPAVLTVPWQNRALVTTRLAGKVAALHVKPGQTIARGQTLAEVQSVELENLQAELLQAANDARLSARNLKEIEEAHAQGAVPEKTLDEARSTDRQRCNDLEIARRRLLVIGVDDAFLSRLVDGAAAVLPALPITSPIAGVVTRGEAQAGQMVDLADHLFEIADLSSLWVKLDVLEKDLFRLAVGQPVEIRLAAYPEAVLSSTIRVRGLSLDPKTGQGTAWAELANPPDRARFLPGMYGQADVILAEQEKPTIPRGALASNRVERFVLVEEGPGQYLRRNVVIGRTIPGFVQLRAGQVFPGDRVITQGSHELAGFFVQGVLRLSPEASRNIGLRVEPARRHPIAEVLYLSGAVDLPPQHRALVSPRLPGTIRRVLIDRDQIVRAGDVLAVVDSPELQSLQLEFLRSHLQLQLIDQTLQRLGRLAKSGAVPERQLREAESARQAVRQRRDSSGRKLEAAGLSEQELKDLMDRGQFANGLPIRAPIAGAVVHFRHAGLGHAVKPDDAVFEIHDLAALLVRGFVSERQLPGLRVGQAARIRSLANPGITAEAAVIRSSQTFADDRTLSVWLEPAPGPPSQGEGRHESLWLHGMLVRSAVVLSESAPILAVPRQAVLRDGAQAYVFVQRADGSLERRPVQTGRCDDDCVAISSGLREGEAVAVQGVADLQTAHAAIQ